MLLLMFRSGGSRYALDARRIVEVVPRVDFRPIPHAPAFLLGLLSYRGRAVPVVDFGLLTGQLPSRAVLSTRIVITEISTHVGAHHLLGLVAESVSHVVDADDTRTVAPPMQLEEAPYLGAVLQFEEGLVQLVRADSLLTTRLQDALFASTTEAE